MCSTVLMRCLSMRAWPFMRCLPERLGLGLYIVFRACYDVVVRADCRLSMGEIRNEKVGELGRRCVMIMLTM